MKGVLATRVAAVGFGAVFGFRISCPAPIAGQLAQGVTWSLFTIAGVLLGIGLFLRRQERPQANAR